MRAVVQRVKRAAVRVGPKFVASIEGGLLVYLGVAVEDQPADAEWMAGKIPSLRIFPDDEGLMNRSLSEVGGSLLVVSQFTLLADARKGRRPSYSGAAEGDRARELYESVCLRMSAAGFEVGRGAFGEHMEVDSTNDGPITILLDSSRLF